MPAIEACESESVAFAKVWGSIQNRGLLHYFFLDERMKKTRARFDGDPPVIERIGIVGAGWMGSQIARLSAKAGFQLKIYDADERRTNKLVDEIVANEPSDRQSAVAISGYPELSDCDLVIECVVEKPKIKQEVFSRICQAVSPETFLATNTSTIPVAEILDSVTNPERLVGLHFCWPVEPLKLVEIIKSQATSEATLNVAVDLVRRIRKTPVIVGDQPGFVVNRLLCPVFNEAIVMLQHGVPLDRIDGVFREFGFEVGPMEMIDFIGVDTIMYSGETFLKFLPELISLTPILPALVKRGRLGRKTGLGFYRYESFDADPELDNEFSSIIKKYQKDQVQLSDQEILDRLLDPMVDQARKVIEEGVVSDFRDVDICSVLGTTFPKVRGGILHWAENLRIADQPVPD